MRPVTARIAGITHNDTINGPGLRCTVFFQGCDHKCRGCHSPHTWDFNGGQEMTIDELVAEITKNPLDKGITFTGGDPLYQISAVRALMEKIPNKPTIIYTGFSYEDLVGIAFKNTESRINVEDLAWVLSHVSYVIMDRFMLEQRSLECRFRGSTNQRVFKPVPYGSDGTLHLRDVTKEWDKGQLP